MVIHVTAASVLSPELRFSPVWWLAHGLNSASRWAVPVLVLISGALALHSQSALYPATYYGKRIKRLGIPLVFWSAVFALANHFLRHDPLSLSFIVKRMVFDQPYEHLYFLFLLLELMLLTPWLKRIVNRLRFTQELVLVALFCWITLFWTERRFLPTLFIPYLSYYLLGHWAWRRYRVTSLMARVILTAVIGCWSLILLLPAVVSVYHLTLPHPFAWYDYFKLPVMGMAAGLFLAARRLDSMAISTHLRTTATTLSELSLGVYLIHPLLLGVMYHQWPALQTASAINPFSLFITLIIVLGGSTALTWAFKQLPGLKMVV